MNAGPEARYRARLAEGIFEIQRCSACARHIYFPRLLCRYCGSAALEWVAPSGQGTVHATTVVRRRAEEGGDYNVAIVELAEGPRLMTRVDALPPQDVRIGMPVAAQVKGTGDAAILVFLPREKTPDA